MTRIWSDIPARPGQISRAQHNREPSDVEQLSGEAAIGWLERILDQYEEENDK